MFSSPNILALKDLSTNYEFCNLFHISRSRPNNASRNIQKMAVSFMFFFILNLLDVDKWVRYFFFEVAFDQLCCDKQSIDLRPSPDIMKP